MLPRLWLFIGSDRPTMSLIELSWTAKNLSRPTTIPQNWRRQRFLIPTHLPSSSSSGWWWASCFYFFLLGAFPLRIPGAVSEPHCSWHIRTADFALLLGLRALSSWSFSFFFILKQSLLEIPSLGKKKFIVISKLPCYGLLGNCLSCVPVV